MQTPKPILITYYVHRFFDRLAQFFEKAEYQQCLNVDSESSHFRDYSDEDGDDVQLLQTPSTTSSEISEIIDVENMNLQIRFTICCDLNCVCDVFCCFLNLINYCHIHVNCYTMQKRKRGFEHK